MNIVIFIIVLVVAGLLVALIIRTQKKLSRKREEVAGLMAENQNLNKRLEDLKKAAKKVTLPQ